ncbi:carboxyl-terminal-processing peptidase 1, chloroplastic [Dorcoceras hygrometricum]|uniref:Carboxyl-terminal-processing peptidase 1, chloroplastic n=1 Tax=Dorcoceras hygrometricum TaxID=472368 RepID=A0A2Z7C9K2_9LAMI|nr:carboxyl-terminal-processing peptidase 1, chloroplastic [Dorcoceras hygrometricum]
MHRDFTQYSHLMTPNGIGYPCIKASGESSTTKHRLLHASRLHPIQPPNDPKRLAPTRNHRENLAILGIQLAVGPQPLRLRNHNFGLTQRIMVKRLATSPHDPIGITDSACKNQLVVVSVQYGSFNTYIPIRSTTIGKSRVARDPITMHTSWRSNSDIASVTSIGYPRMKASGESSTTKHRLLHASGPHPIPPPHDPK